MARNKKREKGFAEREENARLWDYFGPLLICLLYALIALLILCSGGCARKVVVPVERTVYHTDTLRLTDVRVDSVVQRDSVAVYINGDTVRITQFRYKLRYRDRCDTVYKSIRDTVRVEVPIVVETEPRLTRWERVKQTAGGITIVVLLGTVALGAAAVIAKVRKRL